MSISHYKTITHTTCNAKGNEELTVEYEKTFWQMLFRKPATVDTYEKFLGSWFNQKTCERLDDYGVACINRLKSELKFAGRIGQFD